MSTGKKGISNTEIKRELQKKNLGYEKKNLKCHDTTQANKY